MRKSRVIRGKKTVGRVASLNMFEKVQILDRVKTWLLTLALMAIVSKTHKL